MTDKPKLVRGLNHAGPFAGWRDSEDEAAAHAENQRRCLLDQAAIARLSQLAEEELGVVYFSEATSAAVRLAITALGQAPLAVVRHALLLGDPALGMVACVHHKLSEVDLATAAREHKWKLVRTEAIRVLARRRELGYAGPADLANKNLAG